MQWVKASISQFANQWMQISDHQEKTMHNAIDGGIGCFDKVIDTTGLGDSEDTNAGNTKPQVGCLAFHVGHGAFLMLSGNARHFDNKIAMDGLESLEGTEVHKSKPQMVCCVSPDGHGAIVPASGRLLTVAFSLESLSAQLSLFFVETERKPMAGSKQTKT